MKNKLYKILISACFIFSFIVTANVKAQTTIFYDNFDSANVVVPYLPTGWVAVGDSGWRSDSTFANVSTGYTGASGIINLAISNKTDTGGTYTLTSPPIPTLGYKNLTVIYGARRSKHFSDYFSTIKNFACSSDGGATWDTIPYTENPDDSNWYLINGSIPMTLPASTANKPGILFRWTAQLYPSASGTYRIDDFKVMGTLTSGINEYKDQNFFKVYLDPNKLLHVNVEPNFMIPSGCSISVLDVTGRVCFNDTKVSVSKVYSLSELKQGIYFIRIAASDILFAQKIIIY